MDLRNAHVVVTGASAGIGEAIARELAGRGARLTLVARRKDALDSLAAEIGAFALPVDLLEQPTAWLEIAEREHGPVDVLVNNAGVQVIAPTASVDVDQGERSLRLNLEVPLRLIRAVLPGMVARGRGSIVNIASMAALAPTAGMTYYNASKAGLAGASEALGGELRGTGVDVLTVYPGIIETEMARAGIEAFGQSRALSAQPVGDTPTLARLVRRSIERGRRRLIYPRVYSLARWFPAITRWVMDRFTPRLPAASLA